MKKVLTLACLLGLLSACRTHDGVTMNEAMGVAYSVTFYDDVHYSFVHVVKENVEQLLASGSWERHDVITNDSFPEIYRRNGEYLAVTPKILDGILTQELDLLRRMAARELIFYNPDDKHERLHYFQILNGDQVEQLRRNHQLHPITIEGVSSEYTQYYQLEDGRILATLQISAQLFMEWEDVVTLRKMERGIDFTVVVNPQELE